MQGDTLFLSNPSVLLSAVHLPLSGEEKKSPPDKGDLGGLLSWNFRNIHYILWIIIFFSIDFYCISYFVFF